MAEKTRLRSVAYYHSENQYEKGNISKPEYAGHVFKEQEFDCPQDAINYMKSLFNIKEDGSIEQYEPDYSDNEWSYFSMSFLEVYDGERFREPTEKEIKEWEAGERTLHQSTYDFALSIVTYNELNEKTLDELEL